MYFYTTPKVSVQVTVPKVGYSYAKATDTPHACLLSTCLNPRHGNCIGYDYRDNFYTIFLQSWWYGSLMSPFFQWCNPPNLQWGPWWIVWTHYSVALMWQFQDPKCLAKIRVYTGLMNLFIILQSHRSEYKMFCNKSPATEHSSRDKLLVNWCSRSGRAYIGYNMSENVNTPRVCIKVRTQKEKSKCKRCHNLQSPN